jgi:hypothetical protein
MVQEKTSRHHGLVFLLVMFNDFWSWCLVMFSDVQGFLFAVSEGFGGE